MKLIIHPRPVARATLDVRGFRKTFAATFDIEEAVRTHLRVVAAGPEGPETAARFITCAMDWNSLFHLWATLPPVLGIHVYAVELQGLTVHRPGVLDPARHCLTTEDHVVDQADFLVVHTGHPHLDKHIEHMLGQQLVEYDQYDWTPLFDLTEVGA